MPSIDILVPFGFILYLTLYKILAPHRAIVAWGGIRLLIVSLIIHLALVGFLWQMTPLYPAVILIFLLSLTTLRRYPVLNGSGPWRKSLWGVTLFLVGLSFLLTWIFPLYRVPEPTGMHEVGTLSMTVLDEQRTELYGESPGSSRRFMVQVWYPAETTEGFIRSQWVDGGVPVVQSLARDWNLPAFVLNHIRHVKAHAYIDAPLLEGETQFPVVIISHGWSGSRNLHTDFAEELASQGYVVFSIDHTYGSVATVFSDNDISVIDRGALPLRSETDQFLTYANALVNTYAGDISSTIDFLSDLNRDTTSMFYQRLDESVGVVGHSTGGGAAVKAALEDNRIKSVVGLDPWVEPLLEEELLGGIHQPTFFIRSEGWEVSLNNPYLETLTLNSSNIQLNQIPGTTHYDFGMVYMVSPLAPLIGIQGSFRGSSLSVILTDLLEDFFSQTLPSDSLTFTINHPTLVPALFE